MRPAPELGIIVPTFNERTNVPLLVERLEALLDACDWEVYSSTTTLPMAPPRPRGRSAKATVACAAFAASVVEVSPAPALEGMLASQARYVAVMDADLQHDESLLLDMLQYLRGARNPISSSPAAICKAAPRRASQSSVRA